MPYPLNFHVADCVVRVIQSHAVILPEQEERIREFIRTMPVRVVLDLLSHTRGELAILPMEDGMEVDRILATYYTPYREQFQLILDEIRVTYVGSSWYPENSYLRNTGLNTLRRMREIEANDGITNIERARLYAMASDLTEDIVNPDNDNDDNSSIASGSTAITEPLENNPGEPLDTPPPLEMIF
jgi:hypothetical protein